MGKAALLLGALMSLVTLDARSATSVECNAEKNRINCDIPVQTWYDNGQCTAHPPNILVHRNTDHTRKVVLTWVVTGRFRFDPPPDGVVITNYAGHFEHIGPDSARRKYKWRDLNPPGPDLDFDYDVVVRYVPPGGGTPIKCSNVDPVISNRD